MLTDTRKLLALCVLIVAGCTVHARVRVHGPAEGGSQPPPPTRVDGQPGENQPGTDPNARPCTTSADCGNNESCVGGEGCNTPWICQPERICTQDLVPYCGCDQQTFRASSSCPNRPYVHRGACGDESARPVIPVQPTNPINQPAQPARPLQPQRPVTPHQPSGEVQQPNQPVAGGARACNATSDCRQGEMCAGGEGCNTQWTCQPARPCTRDLRPYCGCNNLTFRASGTCPGRPYAHRGACTGGDNSERPSDGPPVPTYRVGQTCRSQSECGPDLRCAGGQGCNTAWTCQPQRPCTADQVPFCGCDQQTFHGSSSCPSRPYVSRGACQ